MQECVTSDHCNIWCGSYHEGFKKWVEVGNSGMFRPEMLLPMGLPEDVRVIAWGLSLERYVQIYIYIFTVFSVWQYLCADSIFSS